MVQTGSKLARGTVVAGTVEGVYADGRGVMYALNGAGERRDVLVRGAWPGDVVEAQISKRRKGRFDAETIAIISTQTPRREPACLHTGECGGCRWQQWAHDDQLTMKRRLVREAFVAEAPDMAPEVLPVLPVSDEFEYRNKMEFTFGRVKWGPDAGKLLLGLHRAGRFDWVFDVGRCHLCGSEVSRVTAWVRDWAIRNELAPYDQRRHTGLLRHLVVREARATSQLMVNLVVTQDRFPELDELREGLPAAVPSIASLLIAVNTRDGDTAHGESTRLLAGNETISERIGRFDVRLSAESFLQTNSAGAERLYDLVSEAAELTGRERVLDLYCGTGLIGAWLAPGAREVVGLESVPQAVADAGRLASTAGVENIRFVHGLAETVLRDWVRAGERFDVAVVDPPRMGLHPKALPALVGLRPTRIVYVSCNPRSLARDVRQLVDAGYAPGPIRPADMFPQTAHVECVMRLDLVHAR